MNDMSSHDHTQQTQGENSFRYNHDFLKNVLDSLTYPFYVIDPETYAILMANSAAKYAGDSDASTCYALLHCRKTPCDGADHPCPIQIVKASKQPVTVEHLHYDQHGSPRHVEIHAYPIFDQTGSVVQIIEYAIDITDRKRIEEELEGYHQHLYDLVHERTADLTQANEYLRREIVERERIEQVLRESEHHYRTLAERVVDGITIVQPGEFVFANKVFCSIFGYSLEDLRRIDPIELLGHDYRDFTSEQVQQSGNALIETSWQSPCRTRDGREIWIEVYPGPITWEGRPAFLLTVRDITEDKLRDITIQKEHNHLQQENIALRLSLKDRYKFGELVGKSPAMQEIYELIAHASATESSVLITGDSGTGKELIAWEIHQLSPRKDSNFVPVNCGAIPGTLFESEFFGYRKGAFTGADQDKAGYFDQAHQGTIFLDEVAELSPLLQVKLLRAVELGEYMPVGSNTSKKVDVRIIAATNRDLSKLLRQGEMRKDFFYRLNVVAITVPPLRERKEDLPLLIDHLLERFSHARQRVTLPAKILQVLYTYDWPGNIRELQNVLQRYLTTGHLSFFGTGSAEHEAEDQISGTEILEAGVELREALDAFEKRYITRMLEQQQWRKGKTAALLGIPRRTLYRKMKKFGLL